MFTETAQSLKRRDVNTGTKKQDLQRVCREEEAAQGTNYLNIEGKKQFRVRNYCTRLLQSRVLNLYKNS